MPTKIHTYTQTSLKVRGNGSIRINIVSHHKELTIILKFEMPGYDLMHKRWLTKSQKYCIHCKHNVWVLFQTVLTFGLSPPDASLSFSDWELSAIKCRSDGITRLILYPEEPAPRGLDGQEFAALLSIKRRSYYFVIQYITTLYLIKKLLLQKSPLSVLLDHS